MRERKKELTKRKKAERTEACILLLCNRSVLHHWIYKGTCTRKISRRDTMLEHIFEVAHFIKGFGNHGAEPYNVEGLAP